MCFVIGVVCGLDCARRGRGEGGGGIRARTSEQQSRVEITAMMNKRDYYREFFYFALAQ